MSWELPFWTLISWTWLLILTFSFIRLGHRLNEIADQLDDIAKRQDIFHPRHSESTLDLEVRRLRSGDDGQ